MLAAIMFAAFMNPDLKMISIISNFIRGTAARAFLELSNVYKDKVVELNLTASIIVGDHAEFFMEDMVDG